MSPTDSHDDHEVDRLARGLHAEAIAHLPGRTRQQLRARPLHAAEPNTDATATAAPRMAGLALAAACAALFALALGLRMESAPTSAPTTGVNGKQTPVADIEPPAPDNAYRDAYAYAALDEDPEFYLWLATTDMQPITME